MKRKGRSSKNKIQKAGRVVSVRAQRLGERRRVSREDMTGRWWCWGGGGGGAWRGWGGGALSKLGCRLVECSVSRGTSGGGG